MNSNSSDLEWTGERYVPQLRGTIALEHLHRYAFASEHVKARVVLDIASGEGYGSEMLARTAKYVTGVDIDAASVAHANAKYSSEKLTFRAGSCTEIPLEDASVDVAVSFETIEHITDHDRMMGELKRVLRPGGILIMSSPERHEYSEVPKHQNPFHLKELDHEEFHGLLKKYFKHTTLFGQRVLHGSALVEMGKPSDTAKTYQFDQLPGKIEASNGLLRPIYLIAVCSDHPIEGLSGGICEQDINQSETALAYQQIITQKESVIAEKESVIAEKESVIAEKESVIAEKESVIAEKESVIAEKERTISKRDHDLYHLRGYLDLVKSSWSWRLTAPIREVQEQAKSVVQTLKRYRLAAWIIWTHHKSGIFDPDWYLQNNPDVRDSGINPWWHFSIWGVYENREPHQYYVYNEYVELNEDIRSSNINPTIHYVLWGFKEMRQTCYKFNSQWHLANRTNVLKSGINPLIHYFRNGSRETKKAAPDTMLDRGQIQYSYFKHRVIRIKESTDCNISKATKIAIHAHIYYIELIEEVVKCLESIPYLIHVYVSTNSVENKKIIENHIQGLKHVILTDVRVVENRGRDIAPMLLTFGEILSQFTLVAHLHTKRSPHNLRLRGWRRYLFSMAFGSKAVVKSIVNHLVCNQDVGLLFPATFLPVRPFMRIGGNEILLNNLLKRYGIPVFKNVIKEDFFPSGSVFWCRGKMIRRLMELNLTYNDFEAEAGQLDGTLAHALERIMPTVAAIDGQITEEYTIGSGNIGENFEKDIVNNTDYLVFDHDLGGGTKVFTNHFIEQAINSGKTVQRLYFDQDNSKYIIHSADEIDGGIISFCNLDAVLNFYSDRKIKKIIVNSLVLFPSPAECITLIESLKHLHGAGVDYHMHDFYSACPSQHLLNEKNRFCGIPDKLDICDACSKKNSNFWNIPNSSFSISEWRKNFEKLYKICDDVIVFDDSSIELINRFSKLPVNRITVRPHEMTVKLKPVRSPQRSPLHIGLIGTINHYKGLDRINELAKYISDHHFGTPMTLIGSSIHPLAQNINIIGQYAIKDLPDIIIKNGITVFFISSIAPETFSYTLGELMMMELPVVSYALGAQGRRTESYAHGTVLNQDATIEEVYQAICGTHDRFQSKN